MNEIPGDLDRRLADQMERSKLRHVEFMEWSDQRHQREKRRRQRYQRFKWLYWTAGGIAMAVFVMVCVGLGWVIGDSIGHEMQASNRPITVILQAPPLAAPEPARPKS